MMLAEICCWRLVVATKMVSWRSVSSGGDGRKRIDPRDSRCVCVVTVTGGSVSGSDWWHLRPVDKASVERECR